MQLVLKKLDQTDIWPLFLILTGNIPVRFKKKHTNFFFSTLTGKFDIRIDKTELLTPTTTYAKFARKILLNKDSYKS